MLIYVSDISVEGSGYTSIGVGLCRQLQGWQDQKVKVLSLGYRREEYNEPFDLIPTKAQFLTGQINSLCNDPQVGVTAVILALDIPQCIRIAENLRVSQPLIAIFPVEADPLLETWSIGLWRFTERFTISQFGVKTCEAAQLPVHYLPVPPAPEYTTAARQFRDETRKHHNIPADAFVILTVADNQERKNLFLTAEMVRLFQQRHPETFFVLVTREQSPIGYNITDMRRELGMLGYSKVIERGMPNSELARLYGCADVFLLTSKAEGLGLPVREAQACGLHTAVTDCTSLAEQVAQDKGFPILVDYSALRDPWGNSRRYFAALGDGVEVLHNAWVMAPEMQRGTSNLANNALNSLKEMSWEKSAEILKTALLPLLAPNK